MSSVSEQPSGISCQDLSHMLTSPPLPSLPSLRASRRTAEGGAPPRHRSAQIPAASPCPPAKPCSQATATCKQYRAAVQSCSRVRAAGSGPRTMLSFGRIATVCAESIMHNSNATYNATHSLIDMSHHAGLWVVNYCRSVVIFFPVTEWGF